MSQATSTRDDGLNADQVVVYAAIMARLRELDPGFNALAAAIMTHEDAGSLDRDLRLRINRALLSLAEDVEVLTLDVDRQVPGPRDGNDPVPHPEEPESVAAPATRGGAPQPRDARMGDTRSMGDRCRTHDRLWSAYSRIFDAFAAMEAEVIELVAAGKMNGRGELSALEWAARIDDLGAWAGELAERANGFADIAHRKVEVSEEDAPTGGQR